MATAVLAWAGESFASGAVGAAGGMAFTEVLSLVGVEQPTDTMIKQLSEISQKLDNVVRSISAIDRKIEDLTEKLELAQLRLNERMEEKTISKAIANIQTHYAGGAKASDEKPLLKAASTPLSSLRELINKQKAGTLAPEMTRRFMDNIIETWDIPASVTELGNGLVGTANDDGILRAWTDLFVRQMGRGKFDPNLLDYYQALEQRFLSVIGTQLQGIYLVMLAKGYSPEPGGISPDAREYLDEVVVPQIIEPQIDRLLWCAEKLALSQGQWRSPSKVPDTITAPVPGNTGAVRVIAGLGVPPGLDKVLFRSEALGRRLIETFRDMRSFPDEGRGLSKMDALQRTDGVYAHVVCRETDVADKKGQELKPWPEGGQRGRVLDATGSLVPHWSGVENGYLQLTKPDRSRLRVARYFWPWYRIRGPFEQNFVSGKTVRDYSLTTQQLHDMGIDWSNFHAMHAVDFSPLCRLSTVELPTPGVWSVSPTTGIDRHTAAELTPTRLDKPLMQPDRPFFLAAVQLKATQMFDSSGRVRTVESRMECPAFSVNLPRANALTGHLWMSLMSFRDMKRGIGFHLSGQVVVNLKTPAGEKELYDSDTFNGGKLRLWDRQHDGGNLPPQATDEPSLTFPIPIATTGKLEEYRLVVIVRVSQTGYLPGASGGINCSIKEFAVSWTADNAPTTGAA